MPSISTWASELHGGAQELVGEGEKCEFRTATWGGVIQVGCHGFGCVWQNLGFRIPSTVQSLQSEPAGGRACIATGDAAPACPPVLCPYGEPSGGDAGCALALPWNTQLWAELPLEAQESEMIAETGKLSPTI